MRHLGFVEERGKNRKSNGTFVNTIGVNPQSCHTTESKPMNKERKERAILRNVEMTQGALDYANELIRVKAEAAISFPDKAEEFVNAMKKKLVEYQAELERLKKTE